MPSMAFCNLVVAGLKNTITLPNLAIPHHALFRYAGYQKSYLIIPALALIIKRIFSAKTIFSA
jgi:hypothetical protein